MLETNDLSYMRDSLNCLMPDNCTILSKTVSIDVSGGVIETWGTVSTSICRVDDVSGIMPMAGGGLQPFTRQELHVPYDTIITADNEIIWNGHTYRIDPPTVNSWQTERVAVIHG